MSDDAWARAIPSFIQLYHAIEEGKVAFPAKELEARIPEFVALRPGFAQVQDKHNVLEARVGDATHRIPIDDKQRFTASLARKRLVLSESEPQVLLLLKQYLVSLEDEFPTLGMDDLSSDLLDKFVVWYWDERLYLIRCVRSMLRLLESGAEHPEAQSILNQIDADGSPSYPAKCVRTVHDLVSQPLPDALRDNLRDANLAAEQRLRLQLELLDLTLLYDYNYSIPDAATCLALLRFIDQTNFGKKQADASFHTSDRAQQLLDAISALSVFVCIESLSLESLLGSLTNFLPPPPSVTANDPASGSAAMIRSSETFNEALDILGSLDYNHLWSPICTAYAILLNKLEEALEGEQASNPDGTLPPHLVALQDVIDPGEGEPPVWTKLVALALKPSSQLNGTMADCLIALQNVSHQNLPQPAQLVYRGVAKSLLLAETELVKPQFIPDYDDLLKAWNHVFGYAPPHHDDRLRLGAAELAEQFWEKDLPSETRSQFLHITANRWPVLFQPLLSLLTTLTGRHTDPAEASTSAWENESASFATASTFDAFASIHSIALFLPPERVVGNEYEVTSDPETGVLLYTLVRPLRVFGQTTLPVGTEGTLVSDPDSPAIVQWTPTQPISGWVILRDVLAHIAGLAPAAGKLEGLIWDTLPEQQEALTLAGLQLLAAVLSAQEPTARNLLDHLDGTPNPAFDPEEFVDAGMVPGRKGVSLVRIVLDILQQALAVPSSLINAPLVSAAYEVLAYLLESKPSEVWLGLRPNNMALGNPDLVPIRAREGINAESVVVESNLLRACKVSGQYGPLLSLLDFQSALLQDLQHSHFSCPTELLEVKVFVARRVLCSTMELIWADAVNWRYARSEQRLAILCKCVEVLNQILADPTLVSPATAQAGPGPQRLALIAAVVEEALVLPSSAMPCTTPITSILAFSATLVYDAATESPAAKYYAERLRFKTWQLAIRLVKRRRAVNARLPPGAAVLGTIEQAVFNPSLVPAHFAAPMAALGPASTAVLPSRPATGKTQVAAALVDSILDGSEPEPAVLLAESVCAAADAAASARVTPPALIGSLGSLSEAQSKLADLTALAEADHETGISRPGLPSARVAVWNLFAALAEHQPSLAAVLVLGKHPNYSSQLQADQATRTDESKQDKGKAPADAASQLGPSALEAAVRLVINWIDFWDDSQPLLESILAFLEAVWERAPEHEATFRTLLQKRPLWEALRALISADAMQGLVDDHENYDEEGYKISVAARQACQTRALHVFTTTITHPLRPVRGPRVAGPEPSSGPASNAPLQNVAVLLELLKDKEALPTILTRVASVTLDNRVLSGVEDGLHGESGPGALVPTLPLDALRMPVRRDRLDATRAYGDSYVWDQLMLQSKLIGYRSKDPYNVRPGDGLDEYAVVSVSQWALQMNAEWSIVDAQILLVRAWIGLLTQSMGTARRAATGPSPSSSSSLSGDDALAAAWTQVTQHVLTAAEQTDNAAIEDETVGACMPFYDHVLRAQVALSAALLEFSWTEHQAEQLTSHQAQRLLADTDLVQRLVQRCTPRLEDSITTVALPLPASSPAGATSDAPLHPPLFRMVLLALLRCRALVAARAKHGSAVVAENQHRAIHAAIEVFAMSVVPALRLVADRARWLTATPVPHHASELNEYDAALAQTDTDVSVLATVLGLLVRPGLEMPPHNLNALFTSCGLLQSLVELLRRVPLGADARDRSWGSVGISLLSVLLALSQDAHLAEPLQLAGVLNALLNNALTPALEAGQVRDGPTGTGGPGNTAHASWLYMLRIVAALNASLASHLPGRAHADFVLTEIYSFAAYYRVQLVQAALKIRPAATTPAPNPSTRTEVSRTSTAALEEAEVALYIFGAMARAAHVVGLGGRTAFIGSIAKDVGMLVQQLTYLLLRPGHRASAFGLDGVDSNQALFTAAEAQVTQGLLRVVRAGIAYLVDVHGVTQWLANPAGSQVAIAAQNLLPTIIPRLRVVVTEPATIGTLIDLAQHLQDQLPSQQKAEWDLSVDTLEQTLVLATGTLAATLIPPPPGSAQEAQDLHLLASQEVETGLARELSTSLRTSQGVVERTRGTSASDATQESTLLPLLQMVVERCAPSTLVAS